MENIPPNNIFIDQVLTVLDWNRDDNSWKGDLFKVAAIDLPFIVVKFLDGWNKEKPYVFDTRQLSFGAPTDDFINAKIGER